VTYSDNSGHFYRTLQDEQLLISKTNMDTFSHNKLMEMLTNEVIMCERQMANDAQNNRCLSYQIESCLY